MTLNDAERFFRQQIGFARHQLRRLADEPHLPARRSCTQASILALELGATVYIRALFSNVTRFSGLEGATLNKYLGMGSDQDRGSRKQEIGVLLNTDSWLASLANLSASLRVMVKDWDAPAQAAEGLIARSNSDRKGPHWTTLEASDIYAILDACDELLERQQSHDEEY